MGERAAAERATAQHSIAQHDTHAQRMHASAVKWFCRPGTGPCKPRQVGTTSTQGAGAVSCSSDMQ